MHGTLQGIGKIDDGTSAAIDGKSAVDDEIDFSRIVKAIFPHKSGLALLLAVGADMDQLRLFQRYAAGHVHPPEWVLRAWIASEQGEAPLNFIMAHLKKKPEWWKRHERALHVTEQIGNLNLK